MPRTILVTGATDGIGLETVKMLAELGHEVLLHGRSDDKLSKVTDLLSASTGTPAPQTFRADLSRLEEVEALASAVSDSHDRIDVLINNAGVLKTRTPRTESGLDSRFVVNTLAPVLLTQRLLPKIPKDGRVVNLSSAAQAPVDFDALAGDKQLEDFEAYAQSKLALTMWSAHLAQSLGKDGPVVVAVNPGSLLASKMVKEGFGVAGKDLRIGADILVRAALSDEFADATGRYFDNDEGRFGPPHADALDAVRNAQLVSALEALLPAGGVAT